MIDATSSRSVINMNSDALPCLVPRRRAWDLLPVDVNKPIAATTLHDIAIIARRLGMNWQHFEPESGRMLAQSGPHVLSSLEIRGLGLALQYRHIRSVKESFNGAANTQLSSAEYSKLFRAFSMLRPATLDLYTFGLCPMEPVFGLGLHVSFESRENISQIWDDKLNLSQYYNWKKFFTSQVSRKIGRYVANELMHLAAPFLRRSELVIEVLPYSKPFESVFTKAGGRRTFVACLERASGSSPSPFVCQILPIARTLALKRPWHMTAHIRQLSDEAAKGWKLCNDLLHRCEEAAPGYCRELLRAHLSRSPLLVEQAIEALHNGNVRDDDLNEDSRLWRSEQVNLMFDNIPHCIRSMAEHGFEHAEGVREAWIALIFRAFCWGMCHQGDELGAMLSAKYHGSMMPVYLL